MTDPAVTEASPEQTAALVQRVRRMMIIAGLTTALGMSAILVVIGYRIYRGEGSAYDADRSHRDAAEGRAHHFDAGRGRPAWW